MDRSRIWGADLWDKCCPHGRNLNRSVHRVRVLLIKHSVNPTLNLCLFAPFGVFSTSENATLTAHLGMKGAGDDFRHNLYIVTRALAWLQHRRLSCAPAFAPLKLRARIGLPYPLHAS
jgi:hypothetical protein